ncbi:alpha-glucan water dikinase, chloroplastic-like [Panicum hallii]|nr:alpha-glucan water dikinase, chloroplastic-like [Panicum hallii]
MACESSFAEATLDGLHYKVLEIELHGDSYRGMPFVLRSNETWIKNNTSDFYLDFSRQVTTSTEDGTAGGKGTAKAFLETIADLEEDAQRSLMHRFNIAADLVEQAKDAGKFGLSGLFVWMRFMATRQLIWNKNYNVKPREISQAQDRFTDLLQNLYKSYPQYREMIRMIMSAVGRGGEGDVGQRIRDEILVIQRNNNCMGGMMEEWHQKLHNNTSPDDVVICQALMDYLNSDLDIKVYWDTLNKNGITKERLLNYDHPIHSEPNLKSDQKAGLLRDLANYMRSLKAVHSGADLESAIGTCTGYRTEGEGFMVGVKVNPVNGLPSGYQELLKFVLDHLEDKSVEALVEGLLEARAEVRPLLCGSQERLKDLIFLDIALDSTVRIAVERSYEQLKNAAPEKIMYFISLVLENLALSIEDNENLLCCLKGWNHALSMAKNSDDQWALYAKAHLDRTRLALVTKGEEYHHILQPSAEYLGSLLGVEQWTVNIFTEEIIRSGSAASLSLLLNHLDPVLRNITNLGSWQIISPVEVIGYVTVVDELLTVQNKSYGKPTVLVANSVKGEEEIPDGVVAVLTPDMPDVLSHVSVRARNSKVLFATCFDPEILSELQRNDGKLISVKPSTTDISYREIAESELLDANSPTAEDNKSGPSISLAKKQFTGKYAICADEFSDEMVGAKSRNIAYLKGKVPPSVGVPTSVALPFGTFETVLSDKMNKDVAQNVRHLKEKLSHGEFSALQEIRHALLELVAPTDLVKELKEKMQGSRMPWPGDEGQQRWEQAWMAIKKVWASKWNERAYFNTRKVKLDHAYLSMAVLVQEIVSADYAFVIHTINPSSGDRSEIYAEVVKGLGETLVGAYPGRALSFVCNKDDLNSPKVLGYPSKPIGLFIKQSIIFRSDSNGEDLEGYAGAGLYDSVPMDMEEEVVLDYTTDRLITDYSFRNTILSTIAHTGYAIEDLFGSPQDIEGVVKDGKIFVVQTRPQM